MIRFALPSYHSPACPDLSKRPNTCGIRTGDMQAHRGYRVTERVLPRSGVGFPRLASQADCDILPTAPSQQGLTWPLSPFPLGSRESPQNTTPSCSANSRHHKEILFRSPLSWMGISRFGLTVHFSPLRRAWMWPRLVLF